jgi:hypothetical protein
VQFMLAVYLQTRWHVSALMTGLYFVPFAVVWVFGTIGPARRLVHRGPRWLLWTGASVSLVGTLLQGLTPLATAGTARRRSSTESLRTDRYSTLQPALPDGRIRARWPEDRA